jgi:hypothetical protein
VVFVAQLSVKMGDRGIGFGVSLIGAGGGVSILEAVDSGVRCLKRCGAVCTILSIR